jgi:antitoxin (DNA-binding transcriptional repressor) of toxin-antitoxin stability system
MEDIETGLTRATRIIGRDVCAAARAVQDRGETVYLTRDGKRFAAIVPLPQHGSPVPCHYCNMLVSQDAGGGIHATNPAVRKPWDCPASPGGHLIHAQHKTEG